VARLGLGPRHPRVWPGPGPPPSLLLDSDSCSGKIGGSAFVSPNFENISCVAFLKHKNSRKQELTLWHVVSRLVPKMHKNAMKCNKTQSKWCINKHGASKIIDMFETYQASPSLTPTRPRVGN
jgi:hypothetical protein